MHLTMNKHRITLFAGLLSFLTLGTACHPSGEPEDRSSDNGSDILEGSDDIVLPDASYPDDACFVLGDVDLDGDRDSGDIVVVYQAGGYELDAFASYYEGDFDMDFDFDSSDLVAVMQDGGNYRDSGCGYGVPPFLNAATWQSLVEAFENDDEDLMAAHLEALEDVARYFPKNLSEQANDVLALVLERADEEAFGPLDVRDDFDSLVGDVAPAVLAQLETEVAAAMGRLPGMASVATKAGAAKQVAGFIWQVLSFGIGVKLCEKRAARMQFECVSDNVRGEEIDAEEGKQIAGCCLRKRKIQSQDCLYGVEISYSDYDPCKELADDLRAN
ncbi:MAG: hypothetical protein R3B72_32770 [Polyangiaceae bacterium]